MGRESFPMLVVHSMKENGRTIKNMGRSMNEAALPVIHVSVQFKPKAIESFLFSGSNSYLASCYCFE